ncbi:hypothetical protein [Maricaulis sp.]|uniref:hypothetical protein n=1 Tax=Maricaulis sp. TaxID=1486257 RepID=UPI0026322D84|nr:hypothetical protein [Maricaulis sp.]
MFDFSKSEFREWKPAIPPGPYDFISCHAELGELSLKLMSRANDRQDSFACEFVSTPLWHCIVEDERHQDQLLRLTSVNMFEVLNSPVISGFVENEIVFDKPDAKARHWVILTIQECIHILALDEPKVRTIFGEDT